MTQLEYVGGPFDGQTTGPDQSGHIQTGGYLLLGGEGIYAAEWRPKPGSIARYALYWHQNNRAGLGTSWTPDES